MLFSFRKENLKIKKRSADKKLKNNKKKQTAPILSISNGINVEIW
jgi:hypothetical protein